MRFRWGRTRPLAGAVEVTGDGAVGVGGDNYGPIEVTVTTTVPPPPEVSWPACVGTVPALASAFQPRPDLRDKIATARRRGVDVVLTQRSGAQGQGTRVLAGGGGVGKSQLAAWFAHHAIDNRTADLVVWVTAGTPDLVISSFAYAAMRVGAPGADGSDLTADATAFRQWLHTTERTWLIVLDDITDPAHLASWWPPTRTTGWTLATTRRQDAALTGAGRTKIDIGVYTLAESVAYLTERLTGTGLPHLVDNQDATLCEALGPLPLALAHAAAYMINQEEACGAYLGRYTTGQERLTELMPADSDPDDYGRPVAVTLLLALDAADTATPAGLARPVLALAAVLDPAGHPDTLWATAAVTDYLTSHRSHQHPEQVTADQASKALRLLHRYGLLIHTRQDGARAVRIHRPDRPRSPGSHAGYPRPGGHRAPPPTPCWRSGPTSTMPPLIACPRPTNRRTHSHAAVRARVPISILDGAARLDDLFTECVRMGMPALAMTDHGQRFRRLVTRSLPGQGVVGGGEVTALW